MEKPKGEKRRGRPVQGENRDPLTVVSFRADKETRDAIEVLIGRVEKGVRSKKSVALRRAVLMAVDQDLLTQMKS